MRCYVTLHAVQLSYAMTSDYTVVETLTGLFSRQNLTLIDPPLLAINCSANCGEKVHFSLGDLVLDVSRSVIGLLAVISVGSD